MDAEKVYLISESQVSAFKRWGRRLKLDAFILRLQKTSEN